MNRVAQWLGLMVAVLMMAAPASAAPAKWYSNIEEGSAAAKELNLPLLLDFWADWCAACKVMEKDVYSDDAFTRAASGFVLVRVDADHRTDLARRYNIGTLPMLIFTDSYGSEIFRHSGFLDVRPFVELLQSLPHDMSPFNRLSSVLAKDKDNFDALTEMGRRLRTESLYRSSNDYYARALQRFPVHALTGSDPFNGGPL